MNYARNTWYVAGWSCDLEPQKPFHIDILGEPIVIFRAQSGRLIALEDRCVHRLAPLSLGRCEGDNLRCMYHGFLYNPEGQVTEIPGQDQVPAKAKIKSYPIVDRHSWLWVWMGDPALADESLIPPAIGPDHPDWILGHGYLDYDAEARLICDNLLDFSHLTYVHANSFGSGDEHATTPPKVTPIERGVSFSRWVPNATGGNVDPKAEPVDRWGSYDFLIPGILLMKNGTFPLGTADASNYEEPDYSQAISGVMHTSQAVTPLGKGKARYFFCWGPHKDFGDEKLRDTLMNIALQAFNEDKVMIEAQQKVIDATEEPKILASVHDRGIMLFNRMVEKLIAEEQPDAIRVASL